MTKIKKSYMPISMNFEDSKPITNVTSLEAQPIQQGYGPAYHRVYSIVLRMNDDQAKPAMQKLKSDLNHFSPQILASFEKVVGDTACLQKDDEFQIHIIGPWNGPVRVAQVSEWAFRLQTLEGHLEAGEIRFELKKSGERKYIFEIESLARSRDALVNLVYDKIPIAKLAQTEMWTAFCQKFAAEATGCSESAPTDEQKNFFSEVNVLTERRDEETGQWEKI